MCFIFVYPIQEYKSYRTTLTNRSDSLQIDPNHYKSIRTTSYQSDSLQIDPIHYKSIRTDPNHYKNYKSIRFYESIRLTTNRNDSIQILPIQHKSIRCTTNRSIHYKSYRFTIYSFFLFLQIPTYHVSTYLLMVSYFAKQRCRADGFGFDRWSKNKK